VPASSQVTISAAAVETCSSQVKMRWSRVYTTCSTPPDRAADGDDVDPITTAAPASNPTATPPTSRASPARGPPGWRPGQRQPQQHQAEREPERAEPEAPGPSSSRSFQSIADDPGVCLAADTSPSPVTTRPAATSQARQRQRVGEHGCGRVDHSLRPASITPPTGPPRW
jgi:hypothetical protein